MGLDVYFLDFSTLCMQEGKALVRLRVCTGLSDPSQLTNVINTKSRVPTHLVPFKYNHIRD